jgi:toxin ParE1/3/4
VEVIWSRTAEADLGQIRRFIAQDDPRAARNVAQSIPAAGDGLGEFPFKGHAGEDGTREWVVPQFPRYLLIYDTDMNAGRIVILRVWHQSRDR